MDSHRRPRMWARLAATAMTVVAAWLLLAPAVPTPVAYPNRSGPTPVEVDRPGLAGAISGVSSG